MTPPDFVSIREQAITRAIATTGDLVGVMLTAALPHAELPAAWNAFAFPSHAALADWYAEIAGAPGLYVYLAAYDKASPSWQDRAPIVDAIGRGAATFPVRVSGATMPKSKSDQLADLVAFHDTFWSGLCRDNPGSAIVHQWVTEQWDPWMIRWNNITWDGAPLGDVLMHRVAAELLQLRELARARGVAVPDIGSATPQAPRYVDPTVAAIDGETNRRFWQQTGYKPGQKLDPRSRADAAMIPTWVSIRYQVALETANAADRPTYGPGGGDQLASVSGGGHHPGGGGGGGRHRGGGRRNFGWGGGWGGYDDGWPYYYDVEPICYDEYGYPYVCPPVEIISSGAPPQWMIDLAHGKWHSDLASLKGPITVAATAAATSIGGPAAGAAAAKFTGPLLDAASGSGNAQQVIAVATRAAQSNPHIAHALDAAQKAITIGHAAASGDRSAQQTLDLAHQLAGAAGLIGTTVRDPDYQVDASQIDIDPGDSASDGTAVSGWFLPFLFGASAGAAGGYFGPGAYQWTREQWAAHKAKTLKAA